MQEEEDGMGEKKSALDLRQEIVCKDQRITELTAECEESSSSLLKEICCFQYDLLFSMDFDKIEEHRCTCTSAWILQCSIFFIF